MKHRTSEFIRRLKLHVGHGYVYGGTGITCTISLLKARERQYGKRLGDGYYCKLINGVKDFARGKCAKWLGVWVADCSNLMQAIRREMGESTASKSAHMLWDTCAASRGAIKTMPRIPGVLVFRNDGTTSKPKMGHVGMYVGDGKVIESAGVTKGVILHALSSAWTHYGIAGWLTFDLQADGAPVPDPKPDEPIGGEETEPVYFTTTKDCCYLIHVGKRFGIPWTSIRLTDGSIPNPLAMRAGIKLRIGYKINEPSVYFTTTKDLYRLYDIGRKFGVDWQSIRLANGAVPNDKGMRAGMRLRVK